MTIFEKILKPPQGNKRKVIKTGKFTVLLPEVFGFCGGVISALKKLERTINKTSSDTELPSVYLLGEIIHNSTVNQIISSANVKIIPETEIETIFKVAQKNDYLVIPAFGIPVDIERKIKKQFKNIVDTTCKNVKNVWDFVSKEAEQGATIVLYAKAEHPEVNAIISRAGKSNCIIILSTLDSARHFANLLKKDILFSGTKETGSLQEKGIYIINHQNFNPERFALANQTTMLFNETEEVGNIIRNAIDPKSGKIIVCNTLCNATYQRQQAAIEVCSQNPDIIMVVGGYDSSNTANLYKLAKQYADTFYIKDSNCINFSEVTHFIPELSKEVKTPTKDVFENTSKIVILAGASCPFTVINQIIKKLETV